MLEIGGMSHNPQSAKSGMPPGTLLHVGEARPGQPRITLTAYGLDAHRTAEMSEWSHVDDPGETKPFAGSMSTACTSLTL